MTIAGGIMGALFHRERTGEATTVDVSLLGTGLWSMGAALALSLQLERAVGAAAAERRRSGNPLVAHLPDQGRPVRVALAASRPASTGPRSAGSIGRPELADDERFADAAASRRTPTRRPRARSARRSRERDRRRVARARSADFSGQWAMVQDTLEAAADPQTVANGYVGDCETAEGTPFKLAARPGPVRRARPPRRGGRPSSTSTATRSSSELGLDWDAIIDLKVRGVVA